ncbi:unnamed protein product [Schistocephalus solidus]|uniref:Uncharacterized protein n=1 Tax=Schistocephalus solidus TaxID=70667 RepID=A0A183TBT3_SCHSO|nr:unnamed protein product [Schistocephalus solidus]
MHPSDSLHRDPGSPPKQFTLLAAHKSFVYRPSDHVSVSKRLESGRNFLWSQKTGIRLEVSTHNLFICQYIAFASNHGTVMVIIMKAICATSTAQGRSSFKPSDVFLQFLSWCGYAFSPGSIIFGPWFGYRDYLDILCFPYQPRWINAFVQSQSFRFSHYFVCFFSQSLQELIGFSTITGPPS